MRITAHLKTLTQAVFAWFIFWVLGLPDYYQQYSATAVGIGSVVLSVVLGLLFLHVLLAIKQERRLVIAFWLSFYYTVPFAVLDTLYCAIYLGHGSAYLLRYWYLTVFYFTPWLSFLGVAILLNRRVRLVNQINA